jgi:hypothetical protein
MDGVFFMLWRIRHCEEYLFIGWLPAAIPLAFLDNYEDNKDGKSFILRQLGE